MQSMFKLLQLTRKQGKSEGFDSCDRPSNLTQIGLKSWIFQPVWPWNLMDQPKNNRPPLLYYIKLCASFQIHQWIQTGVTVWNTQCGSKLMIFCSVWPWNLTDDLEKQKGLFNSTPIFVHHIVAIGELKLELQFGNAKFGSKSTIFFYLCDLAIWRMTLEK